ncbi:glucose-6-phosphate exchanger SLC37A2 isoform X3 [Daphnia magna]|uniref:glucose-6-phosphate exchanger SLC37A2 isoform X3 n=1 Tax=Daphnia magna TaxID=35525 RepID=UPI001E1BBC79|nr:glucose-6-phosphate exchanger SLC37A2 isoform X3 [Daphnia magna]XP_045033022.1 glucose-6-phosphate exchanger SLC37A2 isoform X3 [Daphnia magna]
MLLEKIYDVPIGIRILEKVSFLKNLSSVWKNRWHQFNILFLTFLSYSSYHISRKPTSVIKNVLNQNCTGLEPPPGLNISGIENTWCSWHPFDGQNAGTLLGALDSASLFSYAFGMYMMGLLGERINIRYFLSIGMMLSGFFACLLGLAYWANIHSLTYFLVVQILAGLFQSTGWPGCVAAVGNWFGKNKRGLIMGIWRSHHSIGNIIGTLIAGAFVEEAWGLSFVVPAAIIFGLGLFLFLFLVPDPRAVGCDVPEHAGCLSQTNPTAENAEFENQRNGSMGSTTPGMNEQCEPPSELKADDEEKAISFWRAVRIPGVVEYSFSLFFTKCINYTFLYWLPRYLKDSSETLGSQQAADLSTLFDIGGIFGGVLAGLLSDLTGMSAFTCSGYFILTIPALFIYREFGSVGGAFNMTLLFLVGFLANGPYALITTAVSADLGTHPELKGSTRALATVTAIIDGTGSIGAAIGPLVAGPLSNLGWDYVFYALMMASAMGLLLLTRLMVNEAKAKYGNTNNPHPVTRLAMNIFNTYLFLVELQLRSRKLWASSLFFLC